MYPAFVINLFENPFFNILSNYGNMRLIMIDPQKPVINLIKMCNHFTALIITCVRKY